MTKRLVGILALAALFAGPLFAQTVEKAVKLSKDFASVPGTPRVVRNGFEHVWFVAWRQQGSPSKIFGRIVTSEGQLKRQKALAKGVSSSPNSFDVFYDSVNYTYLLAFETAKGLQVQLLRGNLKKIGSASVIEKGVSGTFPRLAFNAANETFLIFWFSPKNGIANKILKSRVIAAANGKPVGDERTLAEAAGSSTFSSLNISTNQKSKNLVALILASDGNQSRLIGYNIKPDGSLLKSKALTLQPDTQNLVTTGDASFADSGKGVAIWSAGADIRVRKISAKGGLVSAPKKFANVADGNSFQTSILFDSRNKQFIGVWGFLNQVRALVANANGSVTKNPFTVQDDATTGVANVATSYDAQVGNVLVVYDSLTGSPAKYSVKAVIFFMESNSSQQGITIGDDFYSSRNGNANLTIQVGETVRWTNEGNNLHTVTSGSEGQNPGRVFDSGNLNRGDTFSFRFTEAGTFNYFCRVHGSAAMSGTITVQGEGDEPPPRY